MSQPISTPLLDHPVADVRDRWLLRLIVASCQAVAICLTWNLWQARGGIDLPPNLPLIEALSVDRPQFSCGWILLASLVLAVVSPRIGVWLHAACLVLAIALDQMRIQPEFVSVAIVLVGTLPRRGPLMVARCHMISLWAFAGLHKLLSPEYWTDTGPYLVGMLLPKLEGRGAIAAGLAIATCELLTGLLAIFPRTRRVVPWLGAALHIGILLSLMADWWNSAVWPWNIALATASFGYFAGWKGQIFATSDASPAEPIPTAQRALPMTQPSLLSHYAWQAAAVVALLHPALYYVNGCDAYLSWCVYSSNTPEGEYYEAIDYMESADDPTDWKILAGSGTEMLFSLYKTLNVPFPPATRVYRQYLRRVGKPGDSIIITDPRLWSRWWGRGKVILIRRPDGTIAQRLLPADT